VKLVIIIANLNAFLKESQKIAINYVLWKLIILKNSIFVIFLKVNMSAMEYAIYAMIQEIAIKIVH
jgi:hypothetical protein